MSLENDLTDEVKEMSDRAIKRALTRIGMRAERNAKKYCPIDTGLLRNSITWALAGESPSASSYTSNSVSKRTGKPVERASGTYKGKVGENREKAVYIGTNVEYAAYVEMGTSATNGIGKPFIRPAIENHTQEYRSIIEDELKKEMEKVDGK